ncbi:hypothetical protein PpBr36_04909 [Pyricularia pennisetigena]|uniref:hypothetical protein n=1 Tax=Pyricularia pennisetigena TaxID=1578925 RepID=UPI00114D8DD4|nr:hypothetical protein PpBr36_04909 [Pyricularia pennisetigena]TLS27208.1 hypothetical protein PpBr36_04909 [Pyricularia pennisetigena]
MSMKRAPTRYEVQDGATIRTGSSQQIRRSIAKRRYPELDVTPLPYTSTSTELPISRRNVSPRVELDWAAMSHAASYLQPLLIGLNQSAYVTPA